MRRSRKTPVISDRLLPSATRVLRRRPAVSKPQKRGATRRQAKAKAAPVERIALGHLVIGRLVRIEGKRVLVDHSFNPRREALSARLTMALGAADVGRELVLAFEGGDPGKPIVLGCLLRPENDEAVGNGATRGKTVKTTPRPEDQLVLTAEREIVLRCGDASVTLTRAGKILLRGNYLLSRSTGVNHIKGGAVQIN